MLSDVILVFHRYEVFGKVQKVFMRKYTKKVRPLTLALALALRAQIHQEGTLA